MTDLLLVDWLPRGGIAQSTAAWRDIARESGLDVRVIGRAGDELGPDVAVDRRFGSKLGAAEAHLRLVRRVCEEIRSSRPSVVYVQHTWAPWLERRVLDAARGAGARSVLAIHNGRPHERGAGLRSGLQGLVERADDVVVHSEYVRRQLARTDVHVIGLPELTAVTRAELIEVPALVPSGRRRVVAFGVLRRGYKGVSDLPAVAKALGDGWEVVAAGVGAAAGDGVRTHPTYLAAGELRWLLGTSDAVLLPYRSASQSAAVPVAQGLGAPPAVTAVGGIPEQVSDGQTGVLVPVGASPLTWADEVQRAAEVDRRTMQDLVRSAQADAASRWCELIGGPASALSMNVGCGHGESGVSLARTQDEGLPKRMRGRGRRQRGAWPS